MNDNTELKKETVECPLCHTKVEKKDLVVCASCKKQGCISCMTEDVNTGEFYCGECW